MDYRVAALLAMTVMLMTNKCIIIGMPTDIIVLAVIAVLLVLKLLSVFGQSRGVERKDPTPRQRGSCAINPDADLRPAMKEVELKLEKITDPMTRLKTLSPSFDMQKFLKESNGLYKTILKLYAEGNTRDLSGLLNIEMMRKFAYAITQREEQDLACKVTVLSIKDAIIEEVSFPQDTLATLRVAFNSEVIHYTIDKKDKVKAGHKTKVDKRKDIWTFSRDVKSVISGWKLVEVNNLF
jgi:predicted lipid-binding transport protein (Tim44 family)